ncbi:MAG: hypothetical protein ACTHL8_17385 [Burkholderiaceae bacterium]
MSFARPVLLALAAAALAPAVAAAAPKPAPASATPAFASRDQLRQCLAEEDALKARLDAIQARHAEHERRLSALEAENDRIVEVQGQLDTTSEVAVNAFNLLVSDHNVHARQLNEAAAASRAESEAYNAAILQHNRDCARLVYRVDDLQAVTRERRAAATAAAAASAAK